MARTASIYQWRISVIVSTLRKNKGWSIRKAADECGIQKSRLERIESAENDKSDPVAIVGIGRKLGASAELLDELEELAQLSRNPDASGWNIPHIDGVLPKWLTAFATVEIEAVSIDHYESLYVPGPLQTAAYMDFVSAATHDEPSVLEANKELKIRRTEETLNRARHSLCRFRFILDESALLRIDDPDIRAEQLEHLCEVSSLENLDVMVIPFRRGAHPSMSSSYRILTFPEDYSPDLVYLESGHDGRYEDSPATVKRYRGLFSATEPYTVTAKEYVNDAD